jgi:VanZ family protein
LPEQSQLIEKAQTKFSLLFFYVSSASMFVLIGIASCTSRKTFSEIYYLVADFLSLSHTSLSMTLRDNPGLGHFLCYAVLSFSLSGIFSRRYRFLAPLVAVVFGMLMEAVQVFIPSRDADLLDIGINVLGVGLGLGLYLLFERFRRVDIHVHRDGAKLK